MKDQLVTTVIWFDCYGMNEYAQPSTELDFLHKLHVSIRAISNHVNSCVHQTLLLFRTFLLYIFYHYKIMSKVVKNIVFQ